MVEKAKARLPRWTSWRLALAVALAAAALLPLRGAEAGGREVVSYALVQPDAALKVAGKVFQLYGLYFPPSNEVCSRHYNPRRCGSRAVVALESKIQGFVACRPVARNPDRSYDAFCRTRFKGEDLGSYLISEGWALALPHAPFEYHALERIARERGRGVWGFQVDSITFPRSQR
jgi:endonuclease YncB( thermonuclease family)